MLKSISMLSIALAFSSSAFAKTPDNQLSKEEQSAGWQLLFDGKDMSHWRNFKSETLSPKSGSYTHLTLPTNAPL